MNLMASLRRMLLLLFLSFFLITLSACFMMPLMFGTMHNAGMSDNEDPKVDAVVKELAEESVDALDGERGLIDQILIGEIKVSNDLISAKKFRKILLQNLRSRIMWQVIEQDDGADSAFEPQEVQTVLNTQLYQRGGRIWLAQQLVELRTNRILWSGIYAGP